MVNVNVQPLHVNLSPEAFHVYAWQYLKCKADFKVSVFSPVPYFLLCRAIELELKSRHLSSKSQEQVKDKYGHDLKRAYDDLDSAQRILNKEEILILEEANEIYKNKGFEYFSPSDALTGYKRFPNLVVLEAIAKEFVESSSYNEFLKEVLR